MELLLDSDNRTDIDEMVIVTFTRAAAAEMRGRIEEKLNERLSLGKNTEHIKKADCTSSTCADNYNRQPVS